MRRVSKVLFGSGARLKVLRRLVFSGVEEIHERELAAREGLHVWGMGRELRGLAAAGLVRTRKTRTRRLYRANTAHPCYGEIKGLFLKDVFGAGRMRALGDRIRLAFVFGSCARGGEDRESDLDLVVVGSIGDLEAGKVFHPLAEAVGRELNSLLYREESFRGKYLAGDAFVRAMVDGPKLFIVGSEHELRRVVQAGKTPQA